MKNLTGTQILLIVSILVLSIVCVMIDTPQSHPITSSIVVLEKNDVWIVKSIEPIDTDTIPSEIAGDLTHAEQVSETQLNLHPKKGVSFDIKKWKELKVRR